MRPNWFLALPVSPAGWFPARIGGPPPAVRRFHPADLHLTVAFLGGCDEGTAREVWSTARRHPGPGGRVTLDAVVPMGNPRRPSALSATLDTGRDGVVAFIDAHRAAWLELAGAKPDDRPARPHCTVARPTRKATKAQRWAAVRWAETLDVTGVTVGLGPLSLYTWAEDRRERLFRVVEVAA